MQSATGLHTLLSPAAQGYRTTAVIYGRTAAGEVAPYVVGGGYEITKGVASQLKLGPEFRAVTLKDIRPGLEGVKKLDAEQKILIYFADHGIEPVAGAASRTVCSRCSLMINTCEGSGAAEP